MTTDCILPSGSVGCAVCGFVCDQYKRCLIISVSKLSASISIVIFSATSSLPSLANIVAYSLKIAAASAPKRVALVARRKNAAFLNDFL